jgi:hypothetical protein
MMKIQVIFRCTQQGVLMRFVMVFLLVPLQLLSQSRGGWTTPYAHVDLLKGAVTYYYVVSQSHPLEPLFLLEDVFRAVPVMEGRFNDALFTESKDYIREMLLKDIGELNSSPGKEAYIRAFALQCIWGMGGELPPVSSKKVIESLTLEADAGMAERAKTALNLFISVQKAMAELTRSHTKEVNK